VRKKIEFVWESIAKTNHEETCRVKVIGGWLVHHLTNSTKGTVSESMCFVSDRDFEWTIIAPTKEEPVAKKESKAKDFAPSA
jgi:hypothetical protein